MDTLSDLAAIPWFTLGPWDLGPVTIQGFGLMVAIGVILAYQLIGWRSERFYLSADKGQGLALYMLIFGFVLSHFLDLLFYQPEAVLNDPKKLLQFGSSLSSYGGIVGAIVGLVVWKWRNQNDSLPAYLDIAAWALPVGWFFGRVGCAVVHDHPGNPSDFALAIVFPDGIARHDLGLYEAMWWVIIVATFFTLHKVKGELFQRRPGFFLALLPIMYAPVRFALDFMRKPEAQGGDARYFGLTPGQYASIAVFSFGLYLMSRWIGKKTTQMPERTRPDEMDDLLKTEQEPSQPPGKPDSPRKKKKR